MIWQEIYLEHPLAEELVSEFVARLRTRGAPLVSPGIQILSPISAIVTFAAEIPNLLDCEEIARDLGFEVQSAKQISLMENPHANCQEIWSPLSIGRLNIILIPDQHSIDQNLPPSETNLLIVPGTGWGTGHHPTTSLPLGMMQDADLLNASPSKVLDLGCGSGILAIAAEKLYRSQVDAIDIDPMAIENAKINLGLNGAKKIKLIQGSIEKAGGPYHLIIANIYARVLIDLAEQITALASANTQLVLSGLSKSSEEETVDLHSISEVNGASQVLEAYSKLGWKTLDQAELSGWVAFRMTRAD